MLYIKPTRYFINLYRLTILDNDILIGNNKKLSFTRIAELLASHDHTHDVEIESDMIETLRKTNQNKGLRWHWTYDEFLRLFKGIYQFERMKQANRQFVKKDPISAKLNINATVYTYKDELVTKNQYQSLVERDERTQHEHELYEKLAGHDITKLLDFFTTDDLSTASKLKKASGLTDGRLRRLLIKLYGEKFHVSHQRKSASDLILTKIKEMALLKISSETPVNANQLRNQRMFMISREIMSHKAEIRSLQNELTQLIQETDGHV